MCKAIEEMIQDGRNEGRIEGRLELLNTLIQSQKITIEEAANLMNMSKEEFVAKTRLNS